MLSYHIIIQIHNNAKTAHPAGATQGINQASYNDSAYYFLLHVITRERQAAQPPPVLLPHSPFLLQVVAPHPRDAAQLSEIVCENTTQYSRIMMTLLTSVPHKKTQRRPERKKEKETPHNHKDIFRRIKRPKRPALDTATPSDKAR